jgi:hypothetical protein
LGRFVFSYVKYMTGPKLYLGVYTVRYGGVFGVFEYHTASFRYLNTIPHTVPIRIGILRFRYRYGICGSGAVYGIWAKYFGPNWASLDSVFCFCFGPFWVFFFFPFGLLTARKNKNWNNKNPRVQSVLTQIPQIPFKGPEKKDESSKIPQIPQTIYNKDESSKIEIHNI